MSTYVEEKRLDGNDIIVLKNKDLEVWLTTLGAAILKILVKDRDGNWQDVVLGYEKLEDYPKYRTYMGAVVGRVANRIEKGKFTLNGKEYELFINNNGNTNHGGKDGFSFLPFSYELKEYSVKFHLTSPDGHEGFPGLLELAVTYSLYGSQLHVHYQAWGDEDTIVNLTNHSYFNLSGKPDYIGGHILEMKADRYAPVDENGLVTGEIKPVEETVFDFQQAAPIKQALESGDKQIEMAKGLDHPFLFSYPANQIIVYSPETGIEMKVSTSLPQTQIYTANYFSGEPGKYGEEMEAQCAICFETQHMPNDINLNPEKPATLLRKGEMLDEMTTFSFGIHNESQPND